MPNAATRIRIVVVEDSELDAELIVERIEDDGHAVEWTRVEDESSFLEALDGFQPDVIVSDLSMPQFSGYRALELAREKAPGIPFIFVSGTMGEEAAVDAVRSGATDYVLKHNMTRLSSSVRRALHEANEYRARRDAEVSLLRAQRYEALALLASGLSHDLRNVLQPVAMGASMLLDHEDEQARRIGQLMQDCTQRGLDIVASMLTFARGARSALERVQVRSLLESLKILLRGSVPDGVELVVDLPEDHVEIEGNNTELQQCLLNLCLNGLQAMPEGGTLRLGTDTLALDEEFFDSGETVTPGDYLKIEVEDTGIGMTDEVKSNLFRAFFTTRKEGTGLGLLSCRRILDNHKSYLRVDSTPGEGTTFRLYLPLGTTDEGEARDAPPPMGEGQRILVVTEGASALNILADTLTSHGYEVSRAQSGAAALQAIEELGLPELVLMEAEMSLMTGVKTIAALLERDYEGPVVMMVDPGGEKHLGEDLPPIERLRFIQKPIDADTLLRAVADELADGGQ